MEGGIILFMKYLFAMCMVLCDTVLSYFTMCVYAQWIICLVAQQQLICSTSYIGSKHTGILYTETGYGPTENQMGGVRCVQKYPG